MGALWVLVFAIDAAMPGRQLGHQLGSAALGLLFAALVYGEQRAHRRAAGD